MIICLGGMYNMLIMTIIAKCNHDMNVTYPYKSWPILRYNIIHSQPSRTGSKSGIFVCPVSLHEDVDIRDFDMRHGGFSVGLEHMHPSAQLQSVLMFSRMLHRVLQEPLGDRADTVWEFFSERVYHDLCRYTKAAVECGDEVLLAEQIEALLERHFDGENKLAFMETVDFIWNTEDREYANLMLDHDSPDFEDFE